MPFRFQLSVIYVHRVSRGNVFWIYLISMEERLESCFTFFKSIFRLNIVQFQGISKKCSVAGHLTGLSRHTSLTNFFLKQHFFSATGTSKQQIMIAQS